MINQHETQLTTVAFAEINEHADDYVFEIHKGDMLLREARLVGAICLSFESGAAWDGAIISRAEGFMRTTDPEAESALVTLHQKLTPAAELQPATATRLYETRALAATRDRLIVADQHVIGGLAVFQSQRGYSAGVFSHWLAGAEFTNQIARTHAERADYVQRHRPVPESLVTMAEVLPVESTNKIDAFARERVSATILRTLASVEITSGILTNPPHYEHTDSVRQLALVQ